MFDNPSVDISVVIRDNWDNTARFIRSLYQNTKYPNYKVHITDNCSRDITVNQLEKYSDDFEITWNEQRLSFAACHNKILRETKANFVCILNPFVELEEGWLDKLVSFCRTYPVGIVQPVISLGGQLIIGGQLQDDAIHINVVKDELFDKKIEWVYSCCMLIKVPVVRRVGLFDEQFTNKYYEEVDYCIRASEKEIEIGCCPNVTLTYYDEPIEWKTNQGENRRKFVEKHTQWLIEHKGKAVKRQRRPRKEIS